MTLIPFDDPISPNEIGQHLRRMMEISGVSTCALSMRCNLSERTIEGWRRGERLEKVAAVLAVFESMGCTVKILPPRTVSPKFYRGQRLHKTP